MAQFKYKEQHGVIVLVPDEAAQKETFESLKKLGYNNLKIVSV